MFLGDDAVANSCKAVASFTAGMDSQGIEHLIKTWMTTRWPLTAVAMDFSLQLAKRNVRMNVAWRRNNISVKADGVIYDNFAKFNL